MIDNQPSTDLFSLSSLFGRALGRFRSRIVKILLTMLLVGAFSGLTALIGFGISGIIVAVGALTHSPFGYLVSVPFFITAYLAQIYIIIWGSMALIRIATREDMVGVWQNFKESRKYALKSLVMFLLLGIFFIGLAIFFYIPIFPWIVWGAFVQFAFLYDEPGGLKPLWKSKALITGHFWGVLGRICILSLIPILISLLVLAVFSKFLVAAAIFLYIFIVLLYVPFTLIFTYEMYWGLKQMNNSEAKRPTVWIIISIAGWLLMLLVIGVFVLIGVKNPKLLDSVKQKGAQPTTYIYPTEKSGGAILPTIQSLSPTLAARNIRFTTLKEAYSFAASSAQITSPDDSKLKEINVLYTNKGKQWRFNFYQGAKTLEVRVSDDGNFARSEVDSSSLDNKPAFWSSLPANDVTVATDYINEARSKLAQSEFQVSDVIASAKYMTCTYCSDYQYQWEIYIPLKEEEKSTGMMKAKQVVFKNGVYSGISDATLTVY